MQACIGTHTAVNITSNKLMNNWLRVVFIDCVYTLRPGDACMDGLLQERRNFIANTLELRLSGTNPLICQKTRLSLVGS